MSRDRYAELRAARKASTISTVFDHADKGDGEMALFYTKVREIESNIKQLHELINGVQKLQNRNLMSIEIEHDMEVMNNTSHCDVGDEAVRRGRHAALARKFTEAIVHYRAIEREFQMKFRLRIEKQIRIVDPSISDKEIREIIEMDEKSGEYAANIFKIGNKKRAKKVLREVSERNLDIKKIEKTIRTLNDLFSEMQILVFKQQTLVDNIEAAVDSTQQYTVKTEEELDFAIQNSAGLAKVLAPRPRFFIVFG
ncbi:Syntaxin-1A [Smittium mucronatum]|uniref:Syntaxin-1A n=1 Tax=Smittium mucronatum TaxID=133383 RepID=A0A1R0H183_9FUNG|nr:Syntaxin-1A [Smittium mucronatum]